MKQAQKDSSSDFSIGGTPEIRSEEIRCFEKIGAGCFGHVFRGQCRGKEVAIKKLHNQNIDAATLASFKKEVEIWGKIFHPNVVLFMGACTETGEMSIVSELLPRGNLESALRNKDLDLNLYQRMVMAKDAALGINWLHCSDPQIIHRDIKPSNFLLDNNLNVKVCDFGLSDPKPYGKMKQDEDAIPGTPLWMAPEIMLGKPFDEKSDVYSFGMTLWAILTKQDPFPYVTSFTAFKKMITVDHIRPPFPQDTLPSLRRLIENCWHKDASVRPSFKTVIEVLDHIIVDAAVPDEDGCTAWKSFFGGRTKVSFTEFINAFSEVLGIGAYPDRETLTCLQIIFATASKDAADSKRDKLAEWVMLKRYGDMLNFFGPLDSKNLVNRIVATLKRKDFFGEISKDDSEHRLANSKLATYLIRLSTTQSGMFTISKIVKNNRISHQRVEWVPGSGYMLHLKEGKELCKDWEDVLKKSGSCKHACPGHPFEYIFLKASKAKVGGYEEADDE